MKPCQITFQIRAPIYTASCNKDVTGKTGDERKAFIEGCLYAKRVVPAQTQQSKMKTCNVVAAGKKGDERKAFMKECLKK